MNKRPTSYHAIDEHVRQWLASAKRIMNEEDWIREGAKLCILCLDPDHLLNRCLKMWSATDQGRQFLGVDRASQRTREALDAALLADEGLNVLDELYFTYCHSCSNESLQLACDEGVDRIIQSSRPLSEVMAMLDGGERFEARDNLFAIREFEAATDRCHIAAAELLAAVQPPAEDPA